MTDLSSFIPTADEAETVEETYINLDLMHRAQLLRAGQAETALSVDAAMAKIVPFVLELRDRYGDDPVRHAAELDRRAKESVRVRDGLQSQLDSLRAAAPAPPQGARPMIGHLTEIQQLIIEFADKIAVNLDAAEDTLYQLTCMGDDPVRVNLHAIRDAIDTLVRSSRDAVTAEADQPSENLQNA
jgi:hypothetical protein